MVLIDSNIIVYAISKTSPKTSKAENFLRISSGGFALAHQNILESLRILTHPKFPEPMKLSAAISEVQKIAAAGQIIYPDYRTYPLAVELIKTYKVKSDEIFDAYLVATAFVNDINEIATDNERDFAKIKEIKVINPFKEEKIGAKES